MKRLPKGLLTLPKYAREAHYQHTMDEAKARARRRITARNLQRSIVSFWSTYCLVHHFPQHALVGIPTDPWCWGWLQTEHARDLGINTRMPPLMVLLPSYDRSYPVLWIWPLPGSGHQRTLVKALTAQLQELNHCVVHVQNMTQAEQALDGYLLAPAGPYPD